MIQLIDLTKMYKNVCAVDHINLEVKRGVIYGFLGPNGAGKTTTIRMMAGILRPTSGQILINGMDLAREPSKVKASVGFIPDRPFLYERLSGTEFLQFVADLYQLNHSGSLHSRIARLLELFDLSEWKDELIESYSHGMKQRLVMCSALLHAPQVLIVDEPMVGLDPKAARLVKNIFRTQASKGVTIFMSTHSLAVAQEICYEIAIMQKGRIIVKGTPQALRDQAGGTGNLENAFLNLTQETWESDESVLATS